MGQESFFYEWYRDQAIRRRDRVLEPEVHRPRQL